MPANLSPDYKAAEAAFRQARDPETRLSCLREMLRTIPKHKGTEHLQGDIKARIKQLSEELAGPKKGAARGGPATVIRAEGAAQIALLGPANVGKSALHAKLTGSHAEVGPYPFTTHYPMPGMLNHEDIHFQLIDLPPISRDHLVPWIANALQPAHAAMLVVDLTDAECVEQCEALHALLAERRVTLLDRWDDKDVNDPDNDDFDPFAIRLPTLMVVAKSDLLADVDAEIDVFRELTGVRYPAIACSVDRGDGLERLGPWLFEHLGVVRVYTKAPGRPADMGTPFTVRRGDTVRDVALHINKDIAEGLKYARLWGRSGQFSGQQVGREHHVADGDILEIHV